MESCLKVVVEAFHSEFAFSQEAILGSIHPYSFHA